MKSLSALWLKLPKINGFGGYLKQSNKQPPKNPKHRKHSKIHIYMLYEVQILKYCEQNQDYKTTLLVFQFKTQNVKFSTNISIIPDTL